MSNSSILEYSKKLTEEWAYRVYSFMGSTRRDEYKLIHIPCKAIVVGDCTQCHRQPPKSIKMILSLKEKLG